MIYESIARYIKDQGLKQSDVARKTGMKKPAFCDLMRGGVSPVC